MVVPRLKAKWKGPTNLPTLTSTLAIWLRAAHWGAWVRPAGALLTSRPKDGVLGISFNEQMVERVG